MANYQDVGILSHDPGELSAMLYIIARIYTSEIDRGSIVGLSYICITRSSE